MLRVLTVPIGETVHRKFITMRDQMTFQSLRIHRIAILQSAIYLFILELFVPN